MSFDLKTVLSGMSREEALACVVTDNANFHDKSWDRLKVQGKSYSCPPTGRCPDDAHCGRCWNAAINAFYDEAKPKWVEPEPLVYNLFRIDQVFFGDVKEQREQIKKDNARRKIEAFIAANGGSGDTEVQASFSGKLIAVIIAWHGVGAITCATSELAEEVIRRYPDELRLLSGKEK